MFHHSNPPMHPLEQPRWLLALSQHSPPFTAIAHSEILFAIAEKRILRLLLQPRSLLAGPHRVLFRLRRTQVSLYCHSY